MFLNDLTCLFHSALDEAGFVKELLFELIQTVCLQLKCVLACEDF